MGTRLSNLGESARRRERGPWAIGLLLVAAVLVAGALSAHALSDDEARTWIENAELQAVRRAAPESGNPGDPPAPTIGEVFDSADYQYLLLTAPSWERVFTLDLATGDVHAHSADETLDDAGRPTAFDPASGEWVASFTADEDGRITFITLDYDIAVEPMPPMVGEVTLEQLYARHPVYQRRAAAYQPDPEMLEVLAGLGEDIDVVAFFGTWCQICKEHLPALLSTIDHTGNPHLKLTLVALDESASEPADWIEACGVGYITPTFVVRVDKMEVGRIEEAPRVSVEADLVDILTGWDRR